MDPSAFGKSLGSVFAAAVVISNGFGQIMENVGTESWGQTGRWFLITVGRGKGGFDAADTRGSL